jgi:hypothetical protein
MKPTVKSASKIAILSAIGVFFILLVLPFSVEIPQFAPKGENGNTGQDDPLANGSSGNLKKAEDIAELFGWIRPIVRSTPTPTRMMPAVTATPAPDTQIYHIGYVTRENVNYVIFKDQRAQTTVTVAVGRPDKGWSLLRISDTGFFLSKEGRQVYVPKK